jgi:hypothetical protein
MGHYNLWLSAPAFIGIPLQIYIVAINNFSSPVQIAFAVFIVIWAVIMLEFWKRKEKMTAIEWGMVGFEDEEVDRPGTASDDGRDSADLCVRVQRDTPEVAHQRKRCHVLPSEKARGVDCSKLWRHWCAHPRCDWRCKYLRHLDPPQVTSLQVTSIYLIKRALAEPLGSNAQTLASILNSIQISVFNLIYSLVADKLTERENHRTDTEYEDAMISKLFLFQVSSVA